MPVFSLQALIRAFLVWLLIIAAESVHGTLRRLLLDADLTFALRQVSVLIAVAIVFLVTWLSYRWMGVRSVAGALTTGALWVILTLAFEFGVGRLTGQSLAQIAEGYDLTRGNIMPIGLLAMALTPWAVGALKARSARRAAGVQGAGDPR